MQQKQLSLLFYIIQLCKCLPIVYYSTGIEFQNNWAFGFSSSQYNSLNTPYIIVGSDLRYSNGTQIWRMFEGLPDHQNLIIEFGGIIMGVVENSYFSIYLYCDQELASQSSFYTISSQSFQMKHQFSHEFLQTIINIQVFTSGIWKLTYFSLKTDDNIKQKLFPLLIGQQLNLEKRNFDNNEGWVDRLKQQAIYTCPNFTILGTSQSMSYIEKQFLLPYQDLQISIQFFLVTSVNLGTIIQINDYSIQLHQYKYTYYSSYLSDSTLILHYFYYQQLNLQLRIQKTPQLNVKIMQDYSFGIRDFKLSYIIEEKIKLNIPGCLNQIDNECWFCEDGWEFVSDLKICLPICGDKIVTFFEECDDGNDYPNDGCHACKFSCPKNCLTCNFGKCLQFQQNNENTGNTPMRYSCQQDQYITNSGRYYDINYQTCLSICGDGIVSLNEQCDDQNDFPYDGCYQCQYQCPINCMICVRGQCEFCLIGYQLKNKQCVSFCGDSVITIDEQCDDGNTIPFDDCHNCKQNCRQGCLFCQQKYCIQCFEGWNLNDGECEQVCHDNQVAILSIEQCDDDFSGYCIECIKFCKDEYCALCLDPLICIKCLNPYSLINEKCIPFCGDGKLHSDFEECDDGNNIQNDGCFNCKLECKEGCKQCDNNLNCLQCDSDNYTFDPKSKQCKIIEITEEKGEEEQQEENKSIICAQNEIFSENACVSLCGNGIVNEKYEQCDDGNQKGGDGCSFDCEIEDSYICSSPNNIMSLCSFIIQPNFILTSLSDIKSAIQIVEITFTEQVKLNNLFSFEDLSQLSIKPETEFTVSIIPIVNVSTILADPCYRLEITFLQSITSPILEVSLQIQTIYSKSDIELQNTKKSISLGNPFVLSKETQQKVTSISEMNNIMIYSMGGIGGYAFLTGNSFLLFNLLDLLQQLSYLRYMQYSFPSHLSQFLETYSKISLQPILDKLNIDEYVANINGGSLPFIGKQTKKPQEQQNNKLNSYFLLNAKSCYFSFLVSITTYFMCLFYTSDRFQTYFTKKITPKEKKENKLALKLYLINREIRNKCFSIKSTYFYTGILQYYSTILHQFSFSCFLQFPYYQFNSYLNIFNSINAILALCSIFFICFKSFSVAIGLNKNAPQWKYFFNENSNKYWSVFLKSFQMTKSLNYIFIIVFCMNYPEVQSFLLSIQSLIYFIYLYKHSPLKSRLEQLKLILREGLISLIVGSFYAYSFQLADSQLLSLGWIHIGMFIFLMAVTLVIDIIKQIKQFWLNYLREIRIKELKKEALYYNNALQKFIQANDIIAN